MADPDSLVTTILRAQLDDAHRAIAAIWEAHQGVTLRGTYEPDFLNEAIYEAAKCLPKHLRQPDMPADDDSKYAELKPDWAKKERLGRPKAAKAAPPTEDAFDDLL